MSKVKLLFVLAAFSFTTGMFAASLPSDEIQTAQSENRVTGNVSDNQGPIVGASVMVKGSSNGTITDVDGNFVLSNVKKGATLSVTYVGYDQLEMVYNGSGRINMKMKETSQTLSEIVVTGYGGKMRRNKVTNSITKVGEEQFQVGMYSNPAQGLAGAVSGMRVIQSSGNPGSTPTLVLRGGTNLDGSGSPLVMVDGQLRGSLSDINPEDIESINVLKDAGATALYGARASNGVILVTTKSGKSGHREINFKGKIGWNWLNNPYEFLNAHDYIYWQRQAQTTAVSSWRTNAGLNGTQPYGTGNTYDSKMKWNIMSLTDDNKYLLEKGWQQMEDPVNPGQYIIYKNADLKKYNINSPAFMQDYNVNMSGGNDRGTYYAGLGYNKSDGLPVTSFYKRYSFIFNGSYKVTDWLKSTSNFNWNRANWKSMPGSQQSEANYFGRILSLPPTSRFEDEDGNLTLGANSGDGNQSYQSDAWKNDNQTDKFTMVQSFEATLYKNLVLRLTGQWYYSEDMEESFTRDFESTIGNWNRTRSTADYFNRDFSQTYNATLNYNNVFAHDHNVEVLLGTEYYDLKTHGFSASGKGAPTDAFQDLQYTTTDEKARSIDSWHSRYRIMSYFGRANYDYQGKYLLSGVFRYDGYSSLIDNRWGFFPGVSAGWIFSNEKFIKDLVPSLSFGKLRMSYGVNGNASGIGAYTLQGSYNAVTTYNGNQGFLIGSLPNPGLKWEKTKTFEIGLDVSFFENRLNTNITYYNRLTSDKYAAYTLPTTSGFSSITNNNGEFRNKGMELEISGTILKYKDLTWQAGGNISYNINHIEKLPNNDLPNNRQGGTEVYTRKVLDSPAEGQTYRVGADGKNYETKYIGGYQEGQEPGSFVGYKFKGIYKNDSDVPGNLIVKTGNILGKWMYGPEAWAKLTDAQKKNAFLIQAGDAIWEDINGDGVIDQYDQAKIGHTAPRWTGGFNTTLTYKNFTLYARFDYALGFWSYDYATPWFLGNMQGTYNATTDIWDTWTTANPNAKYPKYVWADQLGHGNYYRNSSLFSYRGNYMSMRELSLSYSLPKLWVNKLSMQKLELSITGQNLGYLFAPHVANPETSYGTVGGITASGTGYPQPRSLILGISATF